MGAHHDSSGRTRPKANARGGARVAQHDHRRHRRHRIGASHPCGLRLRACARDRAGLGARRRHHAHALIFPSIEEITFRFTNSLEWDVSELSFGKYISLTSQGPAPMVAIPVFPSRVHRHSAIYVRADRGIKTAKHLEGCAVGIPEWAQTAGIYVRGFLAEQEGVDLSKIRWLQAGVNEPGRAEKVALKLPAGIAYEPRPDSSLSAMIASGEIDAVISARAPASFSPDGKVTRLYPDFRAEEERFFRKTGIFPIMHLITIRRAVYEQHPWVAVNLMKMFEEAKRRCLALIDDFTLA